MAIAILKKRNIPNDDLVVMSRKEYQKLKEKADNAVSFPIVRLRGKAARKLDNRVVSALREYKAGKLKSIQTLGELL